MAIHIRRDPPELVATAERLRRAGHPLRLAMIERLQRDPAMCVCALASALGVEQATLSRHLRILKDGGLVRARRDGANVFYSLDGETASTLLRQLEAVFGRRGRVAERRR
ncbi:MAG: metalloregulator ArsR/SmtB family transcription factor [Thermoanaerobaculaceae bacterium]|nr:metalloregulator ArsR/SmtB family transcription factor [Thermoanaerobaculaceae bacterium]TAM54985.1 MAG: transcriptional regulator [Acidobacteriota bacterium]